MFSSSKLEFNALQTGNSQLTPGQYFPRRVRIVDTMFRSNMDTFTPPSLKSAQKYKTGCKNVLKYIHTKLKILYKTETLYLNRYTCWRDQVILFQDYTFDQEQPTHRIRTLKKHYLLRVNDKYHILENFRDKKVSQISLSRSN